MNKKSLRNAALGHKKENIQRKIHLKIKRNVQRVKYTVYLSQFKDN